MDSKPFDESGLPHETVMARSLEELSLKTAAFERLFQIGKADWQISQDEGTIVFTGPRLIATAPVQIIGTFNTADGTWLWAWDNPSILPALSAHASITRRYGEERNLAELTTRKLKTDENKCWEFAALACKLGQFQGAYRAPAGGTLVFVTFGAVTIEKR